MVSWTVAAARTQRQPWRDCGANAARWGQRCAQYRFTRRIGNDHQALALGAENLAAHMAHVASQMLSATRAAELKIAHRKGAFHHHSIASAGKGCRIFGSLLILILLLVLIIIPSLAGLRLGIGIKTRPSLLLKRGCPQPRVHLIIDATEGCGHPRSSIYELSTCRRCRNSFSSSTRLLTVCATSSRNNSR